MLASQRSALCSSRSLTTSFQNSTQRIFQRYSSSSSDVTQNKLETKELEKETVSSSSSSSPATDEPLKAPISTQDHTSSIQAEPSTQQSQSQSKTKTSTKVKESRSFETTPFPYRLPFVQTTQHLRIQDIKEDSLFQGFRPLLTPLKDQRKIALSYSKSKPPQPKNNIAYWNTSACGHPFESLDCIPKFIGDGMKAFKKPLPPGNEITIRARAIDKSSSAKMKRFIKKLSNEDD